MKKHYRSDIDGLRGLCVLAVVFYHSNLKIYNIDLFSGGYLGVDIFFVISGYIITYLLINEYQDTGKINLVYFYNRRIRRLLPSLIFVILFSTTFSFIFFYPFDFLEYIKSSIFSLFFISNHFFAFSTEQYSAINSQLNPLLEQNV